MTDIADHQGADTVALGEGAVLRYACTLLFGVPAGLVIVWYVFLPGFIDGLTKSMPPRLQDRIDGLLPPLVAWLACATYVAVALRAAEHLRVADAAVRVRAAWCSVAMAVVLGLGVCWLTASLIPGMSSVHHDGPLDGVRAAETPEFLLTSAELYRLQSFYKANGGFSPRVALVLGLRLWVSCLLPLFGLATAASVVSANRTRWLLRLLILQVALFGATAVGLGLAVGTLVRASPVTAPQTIAWVGLVFAFAGTGWWLRRNIIRAAEQEA